VKDIRLVGLAKNFGTAPAVIQRRIDGLATRAIG